MREVQKIRDLLGNSEKTASIYVTQPESLIINETKDFLRKLKVSSPAPPRWVIGNRWSKLPELTELTEAASGIGRFVSEQNAKVQKAMDEYSNSAPDLPFFAIPDLGVIAEPLSPQVCEQIWRPHD